MRVSSALLAALAGLTMQRGAISARYLAGGKFQNRTALETHRGKRQPPLSNVHTLPRVLVHPTELWGTALSRTRVRTWLWSSAATRHPHSHALQLWAFATDPDSATRATPRADGKATTAAQSVPTMVKTGD